MPSPRYRSTAGSVFKVYYRHTRKHRWLFFSLLFGSIALQTADLASPLYLRRFFNILASRTPNADMGHELIAIIGTIALISLASWAARRIQTFSIVHLESHVMADLFATAFEYLVGHSYNFFISHFTGSLVHRVNKFVRAFEGMFDCFMLQFFPTFLYVVGAVSILFLRNHTLGIILGVWVVCFVAFQIFVSRLRQPLRVARAEEDSKVTGTLSDAIANHMSILFFSGARHEGRRLGNAVERWRAATIRSWNADEFIWAALGIFMIVINVGLLYGAMVFWRRGLLTIGDFVLIQSYLLITIDRLVSINRELRRFYDAFADASEMVGMLETPHEIADAPHAPALAVDAGEIAFRDVDFYFHAERSVLAHFTLTIRAGEKVALVGPSGAGKSTVTKLLLRLYDISRGRIEIDGQDIGAVTQESVRNAISFVPQEPVLFHCSLKENIRYGRRDANDEEVMDAARRAHCHEFIARLPESYETFVGERGVKLSGGERQRVAIARAILKNAPVLVLDEATSSLDSESEALIQDALAELMRGKTVVVIAHRLSTIMRMDRIVVLEDGTIVADGTHEELLRHGGLYQKLWSIQAGGFLNDEERDESENTEDETLEKDSEDDKEDNQEKSEA